jgi:general secretion pathway protein G
MRVVKRNPRNSGPRNFPEARREGSGARGFTIIEICIVLVIIGILSAIAVPAYKNYVDRNRVKLCIRNIRLLENAVKIYELEHMRLPNTLSELGTVEFLNQNGNSIRQSPPFLDPYGNPFQYLNFANEPSGWPNCRRDGVDRPLSLDYDLYSMGADGVTNTKLNHSKSLDDIVRARSGAFVDLASKY